MAQSGYSTFYQQQPAYPYPTQYSAPQPPPPQDPRMQTQYAPQAQYSYAQPGQAPTQSSYGYSAAPLQRPPSRINPSPLPPSPVAPHSPQQYGQYARPPPSPQPYSLPPSSNPYPSPVSPQIPQGGVPQLTRRPLPTPRGLPPTPQSAGLPPTSPQPPPSPQPTYATHRPTRSVPSVFSTYPPPQPSGSGFTTPVHEASPTSSAFSATSTSPPRPLPLPRSAGNSNLSSAQQNQAQHTQPRPQSPPKRALPLPTPEPNPQPVREQQPPIRSPEPVSATGQKFVPLWKRALPQPGGSGSRVLPAPAESWQSSAVERRSTVSIGATRPLPPSPSKPSNPTVGLPRDPTVRTGILPPHLQLPNLPPTPQPSSEQSSSGRPMPPTPPSAGLSSTSTSPSSSRFTLRERSRTLPLPSAAPSYPLPPKPDQPQPPPTLRDTAERPSSQSSRSSDDEELTNALLQRHPRSPSPQYGIRDLPRNRQPQQMVEAPPSPSIDTTPRARRELPSPGPASQTQSGEGDGSLAFRMAAMSMRSTSPTQPLRPGHGHSSSMSGGGPSRPMPQPPSNTQPEREQQQRPQSRGGWPSTLPPLPRAPVSPQAVTQSGFAPAPAQTRSRPLPVRSNTAGANLPPFAQPRSPRKVDLDLSLDDAPPPSLRRSPTPIASRSQTNPSPSAQPPFMSRSGRAATSPAPPPVLQREPSQGSASIISLSAFPKPPSQPPSPTKVGFRPPSPAKQQPQLQDGRFRTQSPTKNQFELPKRNQFQAPSTSQFQSPSPTKSQFQAPLTSQFQSPTKSQFQAPSPTKSQFAVRAPSPTKPEFNVRAPSPTKYNPPVFSAPVRAQPAPRIPKISFPASPDGDSDEDDFNGGPVINVSGPGDLGRGGAPSLPRISFGDDDDEDNGLPSINIGGADDPPVPQISLPGESSSSGRDRKDRPQTRRIQETLSNPRLEAAKRSGLVCGGCGGAIIGRIVSAMDMRWHPGCFRCCVCDELLENLSSYAHDGRPYCHLDYHEKFAPRCYHCQTAIVDERFITLDDPELGKRTYHEQHFFCAECGDPFLPPAAPGAPSRTFAGDGEFAVGAEDDVGFTVYRGHPYCEACHVRLRMPKCQKCKRSIRDGMQAVEALGGKWCWECFTCASCDKPFDDPAFFQRDGKPFCERCFSIMIRNEI
ncbi:hypothetical protein C8Q78DRAFT_1073282 [Trametes maxima]|nr:hypothetical protein C8Q78DRAFT_1073282 [Trametes maxima]